jgi:hypothetical protein
MSFQKYVIEISIADEWIMDGFDIRNAEDIRFIMQRVLPYAQGNEIGGRVIKAPKVETIRKLQGV